MASPRACERIRPHPASSIARPSSRRFRRAEGCHGQRRGTAPARGRRARQELERWGPYLSERQWGTVREDYSADGTCWDYFPHDHARSRAYRWGEDGLLGITDRECRLCFALALWNGRDPILKERLFGLTGPGGQPRRGREGALLTTSTRRRRTRTRRRSTSTRSAEFPYARLVEESRRRTRKPIPSSSSTDTGVLRRGPLLRRVRRVREGRRPTTS